MKGKVDGWLGEFRMGKARAVAEKHIYDVRAEASIATATAKSRPSLIESAHLLNQRRPPHVTDVATNGNVPSENVASKFQFSSKEPPLSPAERIKASRIEGRV